MPYPMENGPPTTRGEKKEFYAIFYVKINVTLTFGGIPFNHQILPSVSPTTSPPPPPPPPPPLDSPIESSGGTPFSSSFSFFCRGGDSLCVVPTFQNFLKDVKETVMKMNVIGRCYKILSNNRLTGVLPKIIGVRLPNHNSLDLSFNSVHGNCRDDLSYNYFVGPLPVLPANVSILNLYNNKLSGTLWSLCLVNNVYDTLDMSHNLFTGEIPDCLRQWKYSINLNFAHNKLTDRIPS
ncbi:hypothetical protein LguiB_024303 [Lonicera macranthoides]